jgi:hypothetical protein
MFLRGINLARRKQMLRQCLALVVVVLAWGASIGAAAAQHERPYEFHGTRFAVSIERFMGIDYTDFEGPGGGDVSARLLLNAREPVPTSYARFGLDVFIERLSIGLGAGVAQGINGGAVAIVAPRIGYMFGLTPTLGLWLRGGGFYTNDGPNYLGVYAEALLSWFPYRLFAFTFGPTLDLAFADDPGRDYISIGIPEVGMSIWF